MPRKLFNGYIQRSGEGYGGKQASAYDAPTLTQTIVVVGCPKVSDHASLSVRVDCSTQAEAEDLGAYLLREGVKLHKRAALRLANRRKAQED